MTLIDEETGIAICARCDGAGFYYTYGWEWEQHQYTCPSCNGVGEYVIDMAPRTLEDLEDEDEQERIDR